MDKSTQKGISLIETVIASSVMITLSLATMNLFQSQVESASYVEDKFSVIDLEKEINFLLFDTTTCENNFRGVRMTQSRNLQSLNKNSGGAFISSNGDYDKVSIGTLRLVPAQTFAPNSTGTARIEVPTMRQRKGGGPSELKPISLPIYIRVDASRNVVTCSTSLNNPAFNPPPPPAPPRQPAAQFRDCSNRYGGGKVKHGHTISFSWDSCAPAHACLNGVFIPAISNGCR